MNRKTTSDRKKIRVLVADDSAFTRSLIVSLLSHDRDIEVIGEASNGLEAVAMVAEKRPDVVTMDIQMPKMDGLEAITQIMAVNPVPILVISKYDDAHTAYQAIARGALELLAKPEMDLKGQKDFAEKIKFLSGIKVISHINSRFRKNLLHEAGHNEEKGIVAIASSTGGTKALAVILSQLPEDLPCPMVIAQHIADGFVSEMAKWLNSISKLDIKVAEQGEELLSGCVYIAPSEKHTEINSQKKITLVDRGVKDIYRPSCDMLLSSAAKAYKKKCAGIILTGMGSDGVKGMKSIKAAGGITLAQDEESSVVFGMPGVAINSGCIDRILPLDKIGGEIVRLANTVLGGKNKGKEG